MLKISFKLTLRALLICVFCLVGSAYAGNHHKVKAGVVKVQALRVSTAENCLATNIYHEARGEPIMGQYAVALVTLNRAKKEPSRICDTVFKPKQFSWTNRFVKKVGTSWQLAERLRPVDADAWMKASKIAKVTLAGRMSDFTRGATFYHADTVNPKWNKSVKLTRSVGRHLFYS